MFNTYAEDATLVTYRCVRTHQRAGHQPDQLRYGGWLGLLPPVVVLTPLGVAIGFAPLPPLFFVVLMMFVVTYLILVQVFKQRFYAASGWRGD